MQSLEKVYKKLKKFKAIPIISSVSVIWGFAPKWNTNFRTASVATLLITKHLYNVCAGYTQQNNSLANKNGSYNYTH